MIFTDGGGFEREDDLHQYFLAGNMSDLTLFDGKYQLIPLNEVKSDLDVERLLGVLDSGKKVLLDSGVFALAQDFARDNGVDFQDALTVHPSKIPGYALLESQYRKVFEKVRSKIWGVIEIDFGGMEVKRETRKKMEGEGFRPIPVFHPLSDRKEYFFELAEGYDRLCIGNLAMLSAPARKRVIAWVWEESRRFPHLWVHLLGVTPSHICGAYPMHSMDSSAWLSSVRWETGYQERASLVPFSVLHRDFAYVKGGAKAGVTSYYRQAKMLGVYGQVLCARGWHHQIARLQELGFDPQGLTKEGNG